MAVKCGAMPVVPYGKLSSMFYALDKPEARPDALAYYTELAREARGAILEPMCGTGRYLLPLLAEGLDIEGSDASADMLDLCVEEARRLGLSPTLRKELVQELRVERDFDLVLIPSGSFSLLTDERDVKGALERIFAVLRAGGKFAVEVEAAGFIEPSLSGRWEGRWLTLPDGSELIQSFLQQYSGVEGIARSIHRYELVTEGRLVQTEFEHFTVKHYEPSTFRRLLEEAGFTHITCCCPYDRSKPDETDEGLLFECQKP